MPKPLYNHSIVDHPMQCTCGWYGIIGDCLFDDDGRIGCPLCSKIVSEQRLPHVVPDKSLSKSGQIKQLLNEQAEGPYFTHKEIALMVNTSPQYVSNVARKMKNHEQQSCETGNSSRRGKGDGR